VALQVAALLIDALRGHAERVGIYAGGYEVRVRLSSRRETEMPDKGRRFDAWRKA